MKKIFLLFLSSLILAGCSSVTNTTNSSSESSSDSSSSTVSQSSALDFTVKDADDNDVNLADYQGKKVYINFWATWCGPCIREIPELEEVYQEYKDKDDFVFLSITSPNDAKFANTNPADESQKVILSKAKELGITYPVLFDTKDQAATKFALSAVPTHIFINSDGTLKQTFAGQIQKEQLIELLNGMK